MAAQVVATGAITLTDLNDAKVLTALLKSTVSKVQIYDPNTTNYAPSWATSGGTPVVLTPELTIVGESGDIIGEAKSIKWYKDGTWLNPASLPSNFSIGTGTGKPLTINANVMSTGVDSLQITAEIVWTDTRVNQDITVQTEIVFTKVTQGKHGSGTNAFTVVLSNEAAALFAPNTGIVSNYAPAATDIYVYDGATPLINDQAWTTANGRFKVTASASGITAGGISPGSSPNRAIVAAPSSMTADQASINFRIQGKTAAGDPIDITKSQTITKQKTGDDSTTYWLVMNTAAVSKSKAGVLTPATVTATGYKQTGTGSPVSDASFKWIVGVSTNGTTFTDDAATGAVASASKAVAGTTKALRFRMYLSSVTPSGTNFIDEQIVPVVEDGVNAVTATVWAPSGTSTRNGTTNLTAQCDVYDGVSLLASGVTYQWYKLVSGTWTALTNAYTGYNTKSLTITPAQIEGQSSFKCIATYATKTYEDAITVMDFSDPVTISLIPAEGSVFRNSVGEKNVTCRVFKVNVGEIDTAPLPANQIYEYRWFLNNADGTPYTDASFVDTGKTYKTGKTIKVLASHVTGTANLSCELWTKN
jgi:predicted secreted protein